MSTEKLIQDIQAGIEDFKAKQKEAQEATAKHLKEVEAGTRESIKASLDKAEAVAKEVADIAARLVDAEQKLVAGVVAGKEAPKSLGILVTESEAYKKFASGASNRLKVEANTITGQSGSPAENSNVLVQPQRMAGIIPGAFRMLRVNDVLPQGNTASNAVEYTRELAWTNNAAETAEGVAKPESSLTFELATAYVRTIAHIIKASKQIVDDAPALASYIDNRMRYGVELRIDQQLLNGNGVGQNIGGMTLSGNFTAFTPATGDDALKSINKAIYAVVASDYAPTAIIMNPADWGAIERLTGSDGHYVVGNPQGVLGPVLWGLPVVVTNTMTSGKFMVGAMDIAYMAWNRSGVMVEVFEQDSDNVQKNLLTIRAEARKALSVFRPASVQYGSLTV